MRFDVYGVEILKKQIEFTQEELDLIIDLVAKTRKPNGSRKHQLCEDILEKIKKGTGWADLYLTDVKTGKRYSLDFIWFAFPGLKSEGYRIEGFHQTGEIDGYPEGEMEEFGSLIIENGTAKIVSW